MRKLRYSGFAASAAMWPVPSGGFDGLGFHDVATGLWSTSDIDGDQKPDLVWTRPDSTSGTQPVFGYGASPYWQVFRNAP